MTVSAVLVINPDLPKYGSRFHEFTNTVALAGAFEVGLVTQLSDPADWLHVRRLEAAGVVVHPFSPGVQGPAALGPGVRGRGAPLVFLRRLLRLASDMVNWLRPWPAEIYVNRRTLTNLAAPLRRALSERRWDRIVIVQSSFAEWLDWLPASVPAILVLHDVRAMVYRRRAEVAEGWWPRLTARLTAARYRAFERAHLGRFARVVCLSEIDAGLVESWFGVPRERLAVVPLPVDPEYFRPGPEPVAGAAPVLMFPGMMNHRPNVDGALWFARAVLPLVRRVHPGVRFVIAGMNPVPEVLALQDRDGVEVTGTVPDMRPLFLGAAVVVVPLRIGSGARNKILEAWACGRPVVSTGVGAEGLDVRDGGNLRLADGAEAFAAAVVELLDHPERGRTLIAGGFAAVEAHTPGRVAPLYRAAVAAAGAATDAERPLHLAFDLRWMIPGSAGGLEQHARALIGTLLALDRWNRYTLILPVECAADFDLRGHDHVRIVSRDGPGADLERAARLVGRLIGARLGGSAVRWPELWALGDRARLDADIVYSFNGIHPELAEFPHVVMVPDIQHEFLPDFFPPETVAERRRRLEDAIARARHLCVISAFTRDTLVERLGVAPERITVTPLAADPAVFRPAAPGEDTGALVRRLGLEPGRYLFLPAHTWPHKNHRVVIAALARLAAEGGPAPTLVCTGGARGAQTALEAEIAAAGLGERVRFLGYRDQGEIRALYQGALALVFPSLFEGFGMPVLEAMACGCPVIAGDASSLPEVAGDAALLVGTGDVAGWAAAIRRLETDPDLRAALIRRGLVQAARFSWRRHALGTLAALRAAERSGAVKAPS